MTAAPHFGLVTAAAAAAAAAATDDDDTTSAYFFFFDLSHLAPHWDTTYSHSLLTPVSSDELRA